MTLTIEVPNPQAAMLAAKAREQGLSAEEYVRQVLAQDLQSPPPRARIWEKIAESSKRLPPEELAEMPEDGASQIDHYVYGTPKRAH